ncbi:carboxylesterase [Bdellovibrio sp. KM01]|uniref:alpha/beta hydrolase n=1 Tax=Bdellovibrio sp. KM01 TaxID=2748865 RepID=UPI001C6682FC|nr:alpha/beta hydrolase [Bdellovibrio sp. KM01]
MRNAFFLGLSSLLILLFSFDSFAGSCPTLMKGSDSRTLWRMSPYQPARGVALVVHGLNNNPARMMSIENVLRENRIDVLRLSLSGHNNNLNIFKHVTAEMWERDALRAYCQANERADRYGMPIYYVGYSLGGVIGVTLSSKYKQVHFDKMVLFAPAVAIRRTAFIMRILSTMNPFTIIPNLFNRENYFANSTGTPVSAYRATFELANFANRHPNRQAINVPTLLFIDPLDELVSPSGIRSFIANYRLDKWKTFVVHKRPFSWQSIFHHLLIDAASVGQRRWYEMKNAMIDHLEGKNLIQDHRLSSTPEWEESFYELSDQIIQR